MKLRAVDNGSPSLSSTQTFTLTVTEVNSPPSLAGIADRTVDEDATLTLTNVAFDADLPANTLAFSLDPGAPAGATINPATGVFSWVPLENQGPGNYTVTVRVTDNGSPPASATRSFGVIVTEVNVAPVLDRMADQTIAEHSPFSLELHASDADLPTNTISYVLVSGPAGATLEAGSGLFNWTPDENQGGLAHPVVVRVSDNGTPSLSVTQSFTLTVTEGNAAPTLAPIVDRAMGEGSLLWRCVGRQPGDGGDARSDRLLAPGMSAARSCVRAFVNTGRKGPP